VAQLKGDLEAAQAAAADATKAVQVAKAAAAVQVKRAQAAAAADLKKKETELSSSDNARRSSMAQIDMMSAQAQAVSTTLASMEMELASADAARQQYEAQVAQLKGDLEAAQAAAAVDFKKKDTDRSYSQADMQIVHEVRCFSLPSGSTFESGSPLEGENSTFEDLTGRLVEIEDFVVTHLRELLGTLRSLVVFETEEGDEKLLTTEELTEGIYNVILLIDAHLNAKMDEVLIAKDCARTAQLQLAGAANRKLRGIALGMAVSNLQDQLHAKEEEAVEHRQGSMRILAELREDLNAGWSIEKVVTRLRYEEEVLATAVVPYRKEPLSIETILSDGSVPGDASLTPLSSSRSTSKLLFSGLRLDLAFQKATVVTLTEECRRNNSSTKSIQRSTVSGEH